jgi:hypothetical protein
MNQSMNRDIKGKLAYRLIFISLMLFLLGKGTEYYNVIVLLSGGFFILFAMVGNTASVPKWGEFQLAILVFLVYSVKLMGATAWAQDVKNYVFLIYGVLLFYNLIRFCSPTQIVKSLTLINFIVFSLYVLVNFKLIPNLYAADEVIAEYKNYRVPGATTIMFYAVPLYCMFIDKRWNKLVYINLALGFLTNFISGGLQNFIILIIINIIYFMSIEGGRIVKVSIAIIILALSFSFFIENYVSENYAEKISSVLNPIEAQTVQTRITDLTYMLSSGEPKNKIFGDGIGSSSNVYRINPFNPKLAMYNIFLEIDNGFYYVFHRFGFLGLFAFCVAHFRLLKRSHPLKFKICFLTFFLITNLLSIHYFTASASSFFIVLLFISANRKKKIKINSPKRNRMNDEHQINLYKHS